MQFNYRDMEAKFTPSPDVGFSTEPILGKYRGSILQIGQPVPRSQSEAIIILRYRGNHYVK